MDNTLNPLFDHLDRLGLAFNARQMRTLLAVTVQALMELEVSDATAAGYYERNGERRAYRNGYRKHIWRSAVGDIELQIPKLRSGSYYPNFVADLQADADELMRWVEYALVDGVTAKDLDALLNQAGFEAIHPSLVADALEKLDDTLAALQNSRIIEDYPLVLLDMLRLERGSYALLAFGLTSDEHVELLAVERISHAPDEHSWHGFLRDLARRGLAVPERIISDAYPGITWAIDAALRPAEWQYGRTDDLRNAIADQQTGITDAVSRLMLTSEPLAAGLYAMPQMSLFGTLDVSPLTLVRYAVTFKQAAYAQPLVGVRS